MLPRVLEPEVMDTAEEAHDYDAMDHAGVNRQFVADVLAIWDPRGVVLDLGTGTAQIPIEFCRQSSKGSVVAADAAAHMLEVARANVVAAGMSDRITLELCDAKRLPFRDRQFDAVISNSIVHHIPEPFGVLAEVIRCTGIGGTVFVRDLIRPPDDESVKRLVDTYAAGATAHQRKMFDDSLRAALTLPEIQELVARLGFDSRGVRQTTDRHWTWSALCS